MQAKNSLAKQQAQLRQDAKQKEPKQIQEEAHSMYLLVQQMRNKVGLLANMKMHQQSAPWLLQQNHAVDHKESAVNKVQVLA